MKLNFRLALAVLPVVLGVQHLAAQTILTLGSGFSNPQSIALDSSGNVFVADFSNHAVKEILASGGYTTVRTLYQGSNAIAGVAVDSSGNVYFSNFAAGGAVMKIAAVGGVIPAMNPTITTLGSAFNAPAGITIDSNGNIFVAEYSGSTVKEILAAGGYTTTNTLATGLGGPTDVAVDSGGNVFISDQDSDNVKEILAVGGVIPSSNPTINILGSGFSSPEGVTVDSSGDVFIADQNGGVVKEMVAVGGVIPSSNPTIRTLGSGFSGPTGVAVDSYGNVFVTDGNNNTVKEILATTHLSVSASSPQTSGSPFNITVTALDVNNAIVTVYPGTVHFTSSDGLAALPADSTLTGGTGTFQVTMLSLGNQTVTATDTVTASITGASGTIFVNPGPATHFTVSAPPSETAGSAFNFTVTALDANNNTATGYAGTAHFTSSDGSATLPANSTLINGVRVLSATLKTAGNQTITVTDTVTTSITGTSGTVSVNPGAATHFIVSAGSPETAGNAFTFTATALDANNNTATGYAGTVHFTSSDGSATLAANSTLSNGTGALSATLKTAGNQTITATDTVTASVTGTSGAILVNAGAATRLTVSAPSGETAGSAFSFTVTALDAFNNSATGYAGTVHVTSSDGSATLPADFTLTNGVGTLSATLKTGGNQTVTATDTVAASITGTSGAIAVSPGPATHFTVSAASPEAFGSAFNFTVTALDANNNTATGYAGTVHFTSSDGSATLPANSTLINGAGTFAATLNTPGTQTITATDTVTPSITGTSGSIVVPGLTPFLVTSLADSGPGTLRAAIATSNAGTGASVTFAVTGTIRLFNALPALTQSMTIAGPGASSLAIDGGGEIQVLNVQTGITVSISGVTIQNGLDSGSGGGGIANRGVLTLSSCVIAGNVETGNGRGGGILNNGTLSITRCTVANNQAGSAAGSGSGGGLFNAGTATISNSTFSANIATGGGAGGGQGGAIFNNSSSVLGIAGSTIAGNQAADPSSAGSGAGGAIYNLGALAIANSTVSGNSQTGAASTDFTGGIFLAGGSASLTGTILAGNSDANFSPRPDGSGAFTDGGHNLIGDSTAITGIANGANGNQVGSAGAPLNARLAALASDGGPTQTMLPGGDSPALAAGSTTGAPATDQRGFARVVNGVTDIGAVQLQGVALTATAGTPQSAGANTTFGTALVATATESCGSCTSAVSGVAVTFTAPASGASGTFGGSTTVTTGANGAATAPAFTANAIAGGPYNVTAGATTPDQAAPSTVSFALTNLALTQTVTGFGTIGPQTYGAVFTISGVAATSGLAVSFASMTPGVCTVSGSVVTIVSGTGTCSVAASQPGNASYLAAASVVQSFAVNKAALTVTANNASKVYGAPLPTLGYAITGFLPGDTSAVVSGSASAATTATANSVVGSYPISVSGALTASNYTFTFVPGTLTVSKASTGMILTSSALTVSATILVTPPGAGTPTGTVQFLNGSTLLGTATLVGPTASLAVPAGTVTAVYSGDANFLGSTSLPATVNAAATSSLTLTSSVNPSVLGQSVTFTASLITGGPAGTPSGTVQFFDNTKLLGGVSLSAGQAAYTTSALTGGSHTITAQYSGDATFPGAAASFGQSVYATPTLAVTATPAAPVYGQPVVLTTTVGPSSPGYATPTGQVAYSVALTSGGPGSPVGTAALASGTASLTVTALPVGTDTVRAQYSGDPTWSSAIGGVAVTVSQASTATAISLTMVSGQLALVAVTAPVAPGAGIPTGMVQFVNTSDHSVVASAGLSNGSATANISASVAALPIVAVYSGDANFRGSTSAPLLAITNAAVYLSTVFAPDEVASAFNVTGLSGDTPAVLPLTTSLGGVTLTVTDSAGVARQAQLYGVFASTGQINFVIPSATAPGQATVTVTLPNRTTVISVIQVAAVAPGIFTANLNQQGPFAGQVIYVAPDGSQTTVSSAEMNSTTNQYVPNPISLSTPGDQVYLVLYGTGIRHAGSVKAAIGGVNLPVAFSGAQGQFPGLDQINLQLPNNLAGSGLVNLVIAVDGQAANSVTAIIQ